MIDRQWRKNVTDNSTWNVFDNFILKIEIEKGGVPAQIINVFKSKSSFIFQNNAYVTLSKLFKCM